MSSSDLQYFENFAIDLRERTLSENGTPVPVTPKVFAILELLVRNAGRIVEKEEMMREVWTDSFVEESNLTYSIRQLRKVLKDDFHQPRFIETVPRRGYRFVAEVSGRPGESETKAPFKPEPNPSRLRIFYAAIGIAVLILCVSGYTYYQLSEDGKPVVGTDQQKLAVVPFTNLKPGNETDYLGFAFADTLNSKLTSMRTFKVYPSSMMKKYADAQEFLSENYSDYVVSGTYLKEDRKLLITAQVFSTRSNETLFQDTFELSEEQLSQTSELISRRLINELRLRPQEIAKYADMSEINPQAYNYFLKGIEQYSRFRLAESIENLERSVAIAPNFAVAWDKLGDSYLVSASTHFGGESYYEKAEQCYLRSISLDDSYLLPKIHLTNILIETNRKAEAIAILTKALETDAENPMVWWELSYAYRFAGLLDRSIEAGEKAHLLDPGFFLNASAPNYYLYVGDYQKFKSSVSRRTDSAYIKFYQGFAEYYLDNKEAAKQLFDEAFQIDSTSMQTQIGKAYSLMIAGENDAAEVMLRKIEREVLERKVSDGEGIYKVAQAFAVVGDDVKALQFLSLAVEKGFICFPYFQNDPLMAGLKNDKRFVEILARAEVLYAAFML